MQQIAFGTGFVTRMFRNENAGVGPCLTMTYAIVGATEQIDVGASLQPCEVSSQLSCCHVVCIVSSALLIRCIRAPVVSSVAAGGFLQDT